MKARALVTVLLVALLLVPVLAPAQPKLIVGILHIGSITDAGYNQAHAEGIQVMKRNLPEVEVIEVENVPEGADAERLMESMIKRGARLIIPASFGYLEPALRVAQRNPDVKFAHPGGYKRLPNLTTYWASTPEAFYLLGMAAGKVTKTNKIGYVVALPISFFLANINAFELGARVRQSSGRDPRGLHRDVPRPCQGSDRGRRAAGPGRRRAGSDRGLAHHGGADGREARGLLRGLSLPRRAEVRAQGLDQRRGVHLGQPLHALRAPGDGRHLQEREHPGLAQRRPAGDGPLRARRAGRHRRAGRRPAEGSRRGQGPPLHRARSRTTREWSA